MAENLGEARLRLTADSKKLDSTLKRVQAQTRKVGFAMAAVGTAIAVPLAAAVKIFAEYEQSMAQVRAVSGATAEEFAALDAIAREMGRTTVFTARESAQALSFMAMAGLEAEQSIKALPDVLNLAAAGQLELGQSADIVTNVMAGYGIAADDVTMAVDVLTKGFTSANTDLVQLGEAFKLGGPVAKAAGLDFTETAAALALMGNAGFQGTLAGTALRGAITRLLNPTDEAQAILDKLGVTVTDTEGNMRPLAAIVGELEAGGISAGDAMTVFGQRAGPAMLALIEQGSGALIDLTTEMENAGGTAQLIADTQLNTLTGDITLLKSAFEGLAIMIGGIVTPELRGILEQVTPILQRFAEWAEANPEQTRRLVLLAVGIAGVGLVLGGLLIGVGLIATGLAALASGPVLLAIAAFGGLAAGAGALAWNFDSVIAAKERLSPILDSLREGNLQPLHDVIDSLGDTLREKIQPVFDAVRGALELLTPVVDKVRAVAKDLDGVLIALGFAVGALLLPILGPVGLILTLGKLALKFVDIEKVWNNVLKPAFEEIKDWIGDKITWAIENLLRPALEWFTDTIMPRIADVWNNTVKPALESFGKFLGETLPEVAEFLTGVIDDLLGAFTTLFDTSREKGEESGSALTGIFEGLQEIFTTVHDFIRNKILPIFLELAEFVWPLIVETWEEHLKPTFMEFMETLQKVIIPSLLKLLKVFMKVFDKYLKPVLIPLIKSTMLILETVIGTAFALIRVLLNILQGDWEGAWQGIKDFFEEILELITGLFDVWKPIFAAIFQTALDVLKLIWETVWNGVKTFFRELWELITEIFDLWLTGWTVVFQTALDGLKVIWETVWNGVKTFFRELWELITEIFDLWLTGWTVVFQTALDGLKVIWETVWNGVKTFFQDIWIEVQGIFDTFVTGFTAAWSSLWTNLSGPVKEGVNTVIGYINSMLTAWNALDFSIPKINIPSFTIAGKTIGGGTFGGQTFKVPQMPTIPSLAEGGIVTSRTLAELGEAGPEAVVPLSKLGALGGGGGAQVHIHGDVYGWEDFIAKVTQATLEGKRLGIGIA